MNQKTKINCEKVHNSCIKPYLVHIFTNLNLNSKLAGVCDKLDLSTFSYYFTDMSFYITEKLFCYFDKDNDKLLSADEFTSGINTLYYGTEDEIFSFLFYLFNMAKEDKVSINNILRIYRLVGIESQFDRYEISGGLGLFKGEECFTRNEFFMSVHRRDLFKPLIDYLICNKPFSELNIKIFSKYNTVKNDLNKNDLKRLSNSMFRFNTKVSYAVDEDEETDGLNDNHELNIEIPCLKVKESILGPCASKMDIFEKQIAFIDMEGLDDQVVDTTVCSNILSTSYKTRSRNSKNHSNLSLEYLSGYSGNFMNLVESLSKDDGVECDFKGTLCKINTNYVIKDYYFILVGKDLFCIDLLNKSLKSLTVLSNCFIEESKCHTFNKKRYFAFKILFSNSSGNKIYFSESKHDITSWIDSISKNLNQRNIREFYNLKSVLGHGNFASVVSGYNKKSKEKVAIKTISKLEADFDNVMVRTEVEILKQLRHENCLMYIDHFEDFGNVYIVTEYIKGKDLNTYLQMKTSIINNKQVLSTIYQVALALDYLHSSGIVHRDLKPSNVMVLADKLKDTRQVKLIDYNLSKLSFSQPCSDKAGSLGFIAPEILRGYGYDFGCDVWSLGVLFFFLLTGELPFDADTPKDVARNIIKGRYDLTRHTIDVTIKELISQCLEVNPNRRISVKTFLNSNVFMNINMA
jgi:tRNA A-37 threonylcarbamoyl transferase component Bud32